MSVSNLVKIDKKCDRESVHRRTHTHTHAQTQNDFITCPMLYAIAMGQIIIAYMYVSREAPASPHASNSVEGYLQNGDKSSVRTHMTHCGTIVDVLTWLSRSFKLFALAQI